MALNTFKNTIITCFRTKFLKVVHFMRENVCVVIICVSVSVSVPPTNFRTNSQIVKELCMNTMPPVVNVTSKVSTSYHKYYQ
jgi:hypothetical protein